MSVHVAVLVLTRLGLNDARIDEVAEAIALATGPGDEQALIVAGIGMYRLNLTPALPSAGQIAP